MPKGERFDAGALVFAKVKGYPPWPARITGIVGKDRFKVFFYGTYETATLKSEDIWHYSAETKEKFAPKNLKRKGYPEGLDQIEHTPEIAAVDDDALIEDANSSAAVDTSVDSTPVANAQKKKSLPATPVSGKEAKTPKSVKKIAANDTYTGKKPAKPAESPQKAEVTPVDSKGRKAAAGGAEPVLVKPAAERKVRPSVLDAAAVPSPTASTPGRAGSRGEKRKAEATESGAATPNESPLKKAAKGEPKVEAGSPGESLTAPVSRSGRLIKPKKFDDDVHAASSPSRSSDNTDSEGQVTNGDTKGNKAAPVSVKKEKNSAPLVSPRVNAVGGGGDGPNTTKTPKAKAATLAETTPKVKREQQLEASQTSLLTPDQEKQRRLEKRKNKLRWLKIEQRLVELDIAVKSSLHLERPSPDRCISALEELNELKLAPFMLKKQPDIVTTVRRLRKYIGPQAFNNWPDQEARLKMQKSIEIIQQKADQIYNKFKSYFAYQGEKPFSVMFEQEVEEFRKLTQGMDESKVLSMIRDPTRPVSADNPSDEDD